MSVQIICKKITLGYEGNIVTENIAFTVNKGDYLCILGENGSGKSTLVKALLGLKSQVSGEINRSNDCTGKEIGYLPQQTVVQRDFPASVREIVRSGCLAKCGFRPFYNKQEKELAENTMEQLGIHHLAKKCYRELSGGQQQEYCWQGLCVLPEKFFCLTNPLRDLTRKLKRICMN